MNIETIMNSIPVWFFYVAVAVQICLSIYWSIIHQRATKATIDQKDATIQAINTGKDSHIGQLKSRIEMLESQTPERMMAKITALNKWIAETEAALDKSQKELENARGDNENLRKEKKILEEYKKRVEAIDGKAMLAALQQTQTATSTMWSVYFDAQKKAENIKRALESSIYAPLINATLPPPSMAYNPYADIISLDSSKRE